MMGLNTVVLGEGGLGFAAEVILRGGLVAVPTETVYGLACNGLDADAVARLYEVKGRPAAKPISLLVPDLGVVGSVCDGIPVSARRLAEAFWPGPLTIVLRHNGAVPGIVTAGGCTVGIRCPDHPLALGLLRLAGVPLAAPSANVSGMPSPTCAGEVLAYFDGKIDCVIDGGLCALGVESTIVDLSGAQCSILRLGALSEVEILDAIGEAGDY